MKFIDNKLSLSHKSDAADTKNDYFLGKEMLYPFDLTVGRLLWDTLVILQPPPRDSHQHTDECP